MKITKVRDVKTPTRGTSKSAGLDFYIPNDYYEARLNPGMDILIPSGIKANIPEGYMLIAENKSGVVTSSIAMLAAGKVAKPGSFSSSLIVGAKVCDEDYQGEIHIHVINVGSEHVILKPGMKIAQFILVPVKYEDVEVVSENELFEDTTERGDGGFGSTGKY